MTGEELDRAIEFLLQGQANHQVRLDELTAQVTATNRRLEMYAETQSQFIEIVTRSLEALAATQAQTDQRIAESNARTDQLIAESRARADEQIAESNARADARLDRLAAMLDRHVLEGHGKDS